MYSYKNSKRAGVLFCAVMLLAVTLSAAPGVGDSAPDFTLKTHDDKSLTLSKLKGKRGVVLVFFATWCPPCMAEVPQVKAFVEKSKKKNVLVYGVNYKQPLDVVTRFVKEKKVNYRVVLDSDGAVSELYGVRGIPYILGIDADGIIRYAGHSIPEDADAFIKTLTKSLPLSSLKKKAVTAATPKITMQHGVPTIDRATLKQWMASDEPLTIVDVLSPEMYHKEHVPGALNIPLAALGEFHGRIPKDGKVVMYCASFQCLASTEATKQLRANGWTNVYDYAGGIRDWVDAGEAVARGEHAVQFIGWKDLQARIKHNPDLVILDVLSPESYGKAHITGAVNIPLAELSERIATLDKEKTYVTYCANYICQASSHAAETLIAAGFPKVYDYKGGIKEWQGLKLPVGQK